LCEDPIPQLLAILREESSIRVRDQAVSGLQNYPRDLRALNALAALAAAHPERDNYASGLAGALSANAAPGCIVGRIDVVGRLIELVHHRSNKVRSQAMRGLSRALPDPAAYEALSAIADINPPTPLTYQARRLIRQMVTPTRME
jgi:hypothetical protein